MVGCRRTDRTKNLPKKKNENEDKNSKVKEIDEDVVGSSSFFFVFSFPLVPCFVAPVGLRCKSEKKKIGRKNLNEKKKKKLFLENLETQKL